MSKRYLFGSQPRRNLVEDRPRCLPRDTAGQAVRQFLKGQVRTDLPFKLSNYRPGGEGTESLLTRILTEYDVGWSRAPHCFPGRNSYTSRRSLFSL